MHLRLVPWTTWPQDWEQQDADDGREWDPIRALSSLTRLGLKDCSLLALPPALTALRSLASLDASENHFDVSPGEESAFDPLEGLGALTHLDLSQSIYTHHVPHQLSALRSLAIFSMRDSQVWEAGVAGDFEPLRELPALKVIKTGVPPGRRAPALEQAFGSIVQL